MLYKKYKMGTYKPKPLKKNISKRHNKTYKGALTLRIQKEQRRIMLLLIIGFISIGIVQAIVITENTIHISGSMVEAKAETVKQANQQLVEEVLDPPVTSSRVVENEIIKQAKIHGVNVNTALAIARCESNFNPNAKNKTSSASGVWQFTAGTFLDGIRWRGLDWTLEDRFDYKKSTDMAMYFVKKEGWGRWECSKLIG